MRELDKQLASLERKLDKISQTDTLRAYAAAINKVATRAKTDVARVTASEHKIRVGDIKKRIYIGKATARRGFSLVSFYTKPMSAIRTNFKPTKSGYKVAGEIKPRSFFAKGRNNKRHHIYQRTGKTRLPIDMVRVDFSRTVNRVGVQVVRKKMKSDFRDLLKREFNARIKGYVQRSR